MLTIVGLGEATDIDELRAGVTALLERAEDIDDRERPLVAIGKVVLWLFAGEPERADEAHTRALEHPDPWVRVAIRMLAAGRAENDGSLDTMAVELAAARAGFEALGDALGARDGALLRVRPAAAGGRPGGGREDARARRAPRWRSSARRTRPA